MALLALALIVSAVSPAQAEPLRTESLSSLGGKKQYPEIDEARKKLARGDVDGALETLNAAAAAHSELPSGRMILAYIYYTANRPNEGRAMLERAVVETPDDPDPYLYMAEQANREMQWTVAKMLGEKALALSTASKASDEKKKELMRRSLMMIAQADFGRDDWDSAYKTVTELVKLSPDNSAVHFNMAKVLFALKKEQEAYAELQTALKLNPEMSSPDTVMGQLWDEAKDRAKAETWMKRAITNDGKRLKTRIEVAKWYLDVDRIKEAKEQVAEALKIDPQSPDAQFLAGRLSRLSKNYQQAKKYLEQSYVMAPGNPAVASELALTLNELGEDERQRALTIAQLTANQNKNNVEALATLGWIYYRLGRLDEAEQLLNTVFSAQRLNPDSLYFIAALLDSRNRGADARPLLEAALKAETPFAYRDDAKALLARIEKTAPADAKSAPASGGAKKPATPGAASAP